ncbi:hypothetical protein Daesc_001931 [Daldinia eschscholtzii]|uniref:Uncharacterized protein n=1 Tax=Daldinia eschscholtzii TaxID=292717 RepID=A0AAX6MWU6_9PEZI
MHYLIIRNRSNHDQTFVCNGYNGGNKLVVRPNEEARIEAPDGTSGAIIAEHDGVVAEQCEITKHGWMGNDTIDISNICGAGGNMTCQQVGDPPGQFKGHETFMQACNAAYHKLSQERKNQLNGFVFLDENGNVKRIGAPKDSKPLEDFVRTFADGRTYIGVASAGNARDNEQSKAGNGSKDILIIYSDENAAPDPNHPFTNLSVDPSAFLSLAAAPAEVPGPAGPGILLTNHSSKTNKYFFYNNYWNGNGEAGANFDRPLKDVELGPNQTVHVPLGLDFKGRVQRGTELPATWGEFQVKAADDGRAHGDISIQQGCDGAATVASTDGTSVSNGFTENIIEGAPEAALDKKPSGEKALASTEGNWNGPGNQAAIDWEYQKLGSSKAYIKGGSGVPDVASKNNCLHFTFYVP